MCWEKQTLAYRGFIPCQIPKATQSYWAGFSSPSCNAPFQDTCRDKCQWQFLLCQDQSFLFELKKKLQIKIVTLSISLLDFMTSYFLNVLTHHKAQHLPKLRSIHCQWMDIKKQAVKARVHWKAGMKGSPEAPNQTPLGAGPWHGWKYTRMVFPHSGAGPRAARFIWESFLYCPTQVWRVSVENIRL